MKGEGSKTKDERVIRGERNKAKRTAKEVAP
jgi:hypothetical protein